jgi:superfamily I DNA/RNA helicase
LRALTPVGPNDLFLVGDPYQRIYSRKLNFKSAGINIAGRSRRLRVNYRTTEEIKKHAVSIVSGMEVDDFDGNAENLRGYVSLLHGEAPIYQMYPNKNQELDAIATYIRQCLDAGIRPDDICVAAYRNDMVDSTANYLSRQASIPCRRWNGGDIDGVRAYTFHRMKGLEFRVVILTDVSRNTIPYHPSNYQELDDEQKRQIDQQQRSLMYVALTRAVNRVLITGCGEPSSFLKSLK